MVYCECPDIQCLQALDTIPAKEMMRSEEGVGFTVYLIYLTQKWLMCHGLCLYSLVFFISCWVKRKSAVIPLNRRWRYNLCISHRENRTEQELRRHAVSRADLAENLMSEVRLKFHICLPFGQI